MGADLNLVHPWPVRDIPLNVCLSLEEMKLLDNHAMSTYKLPIELMMENAGFHLASIAAMLAPNPSTILIGCGSGNNGGGGLVAARRLSAWGYDVYLDLPSHKLAELPAKQLTRAEAFGINKEMPNAPVLAIDAYFGFSQRLPFEGNFASAIQQMNSLDCTVLSLDIPTGIPENSNEPNGPYISAQVICTLAAPKKLLYSSLIDARIFIVDLGIPRQAYRDLDLIFSNGFGKGAIWEMVRQEAD